MGFYLRGWIEKNQRDRTIKVEYGNTKAALDIQQERKKTIRVVLTLGASTIIWHEDKRGKAADNGDLDLAAVAAAVWQQQWPADSRKWWLSARWQGNSSETSAPHFLFLCKVRKEAEEALTCGECRCR